MNINRCYGCMEEITAYPCPRCGFAPTQGVSIALAPGTILNGKYLIGKPLGQGGFGITYIGWDLVLERKVAIKEYYPAGLVVRKNGTDLQWYATRQAQEARESGRDMFLKEARKMSCVSGISHVVQVQEMFQENETAYIVMDYIEGETLKQRLRKTGPLSWKEAKEIFLPVIQTMDRVHQAGLIHRDLSPDNLMLLPDGGVKILDLGAAKDLNVNSGVSSAQVAKEGYSPFEQYTQRGGAGPWSDVYALAATMYYTLTGEVPPIATDRVEDDTMDWSLLTKRGVPTKVIAALQEALRVSAKDRTQTMAELYRDITGSRHVSKKRKKTASKPGKAMLIAGAAALVCVGLALAFLRKPADTLEQEYGKAIQLLEAGQYGEAAGVFAGLGDYRDSADQAKEAAGLAAYAAAEGLLADGETARAAIAFGTLGDYKDARRRSVTLWEEIAQRDTVGAGSNHTVALKNNGTVAAVGDNGSGQCNVGTWQDIVAVSAGEAHTVGLKADGTVVAAGGSTYGQCSVRNWRDCVAVSAGWNHTVGLKADGTVVAVGDNHHGQCDVSDWQDIVAISAGNGHTVGLRADGTVVAAGDDQYGQCQVSGWRDMISISSGSFHTAGLKADGTVTAVGSNAHGQCDTGELYGIVSVSAGGYHTLGLRADGVVKAVGSNDAGQCDTGSWQEMAAVFTGKQHSVGLKADGTLVAAGDNAVFGQCNVSDWMRIRLPGGRAGEAMKENAFLALYTGAEKSLSRGQNAQAAIAFGTLGDYRDARERSFALWAGITQRDTVSAGTSHTVGIKANGTVVAVGSNEYGQCDVGVWRDIAAVSAGDNHTVGLKADGTVVAVGDNSHGQCNVDSWENIVAISAGQDYTVGLRADGTVTATGANTYCQCNVDSWRDITAISAASCWTAGLKTDGTVVTAGDNGYSGCDADGWQGIAAISMAGDISIGLRADGTVAAIRGNHYAKVQGDRVAIDYTSENLDVDRWQDIFAVSAGENHALGLKADGTVMAVGINAYGQCSVSSWRDIIAVSAGAYHTVGLKADGTVVAAGNNTAGQCDVSGWTDIRLPK